MFILGLLGLGMSNILLRAKESSSREELRKNQEDIQRELIRRLRHHFERHSSKIMPAPHRLTMSTPRGEVIVETICVDNNLDWQTADNLMKSCVKCKPSQHPVIRIKEPNQTLYFPGQLQKAELPAAVSICFKKTSDPNEVGIEVATLMIDPITHQAKRVNSFETYLVKDASNFTFYE